VAGGAGERQRKTARQRSSHPDRGGEGKRQTPAPRARG
jgi:hypothetical protein